MTMAPSVVDVAVCSELVGVIEEVVAEVSILLVVVAEVMLIAVVLAVSVVFELSVVI